MDCIKIYYDAQIRVLRYRYSYDLKTRRCPTYTEWIFEYDGKEIKERAGFRFRNVLSFKKHLQERWSSIAIEVLKPEYIKLDYKAQSI